MAQEISRTSQTLQIRNVRNVLPTLLWREKIIPQTEINRKFRRELGGCRLLTPNEIIETDNYSAYVERAVRTVLIIDLVESVRLIEENEKSTVSRWLQLTRHIERVTLPRHEGRLVKSLGDGLLLDFESTKPAAAAAFEIQRICNDRNIDQPLNRHFHLRMGIEIADLYISDQDIYGHGVNLAARLMTLAGPGEIVISAATRDRLTADLDADIEDLGDCYLKHITEPVRAYRIGPTGPNPVIKTGQSKGVLLPTIAVLPFFSRRPTHDRHLLGDVIADELIQAFSISQYLKVISRLSTSAFRGQSVTLDSVATHLNANYVLSGSYLVDGNKFTLIVELADIKSNEVVWSERIRDDIGGIFAGEQELIGRIVAEVGSAIIARELRRARTQPLPTLESYSLLISAITLMHRMSYRDFQNAFSMLQLVSDRASRQAVPQAWIAKWYVLRAQQGWSDNPDRDSHLAQDAAKRALDADPESSLALTIDGLVHTHMLKDHDTANQRYALAVTTNPNNSLAWLLKGTGHAFTGDGVTAVADTQRSIGLSPLDPHRYYYDTLAATAFLSNHQYDLALKSAERSLRANKTHTSTLRAKAIAYWQLGEHDKAREVGADLMTLEPNLSISSWLARSPSVGYEIGNEWARVLAEIGVPK